MQSTNMQRSNENFTECLSNDFYWFGLFRSPYCKISYLLADIKNALNIWQPTYDSVCGDNSWIHAKRRQRVYHTFTNVFFYFFPVF